MVIKTFHELGRGGDKVGGEIALNLNQRANPGQSGDKTAFSRGQRSQTGRPVARSHPLKRKGG
jgi:hypothetical protein